MSASDAGTPDEPAVHAEARLQTRIQSVSRAIRVLLAVAGADDGAVARTLAQEFVLSLPTTYHLLNTLVDEGILFKDDRRRYFLGPSAAIIGDAYNRSALVPGRYLRALRDVAAATGETAYLSAWRNNAISVLETAEGSHAVRVAGLTSGYSDDIHARASGKLLLAFSPAETVRSMLERMVFRRVTAHTIVSRSAFLAELETVRAEGVAFDRQEFRIGVDCVSAPITENGNVVACITLSCPSERFVETRESIVATLRATTRAASSS